MSHIGSTGWWNGSTDIEGFIEAGTRLPGYMYGLRTEQPYFLPLLHEEDFIHAYRICSPLKAIVSRRSKATSNGLVEVLNVDKTKPARGREAKMLRDMFGVDGNSRPNVLQTADQFFSQQDHYVDLCGYCPFIVMRPTGFVDEIKAVWNIPPWLFDIEYTRKWLWEYKLTGIYKKFFMVWEGKRIEIDPKDLSFIFDDGIGTETDSNLLIPDSRLVGMDYIVSNIVAAYKSRNTLITKRGAVGILSNEGTDSRGTPLTIDSDIRDNLQQDFRNYGIVGQPFQIIVTDAKLKWQQMGFATKDLLLFEEIEDDIFRLCDVYGYPRELMSQQKGATYENKIQARVDLYHDSIIPENNSRMRQFTSGVVSKDSGIKLVRNFDAVPVLQKEKLNAALTRKAISDAMLIEYNNGLATKNMWLEELGMDTVEDPAFDEYKQPEEIDPLTGKPKTPEDKDKKPSKDKEDA